MAGIGASFPRVSVIPHWPIMSDAPLSLPRLTFSDRPKWVALHHLAWEIAAKNVVRHPLAGWHPHVACMPGVPILWVWDSCFIALFARYGNGVLPALGNLDGFYDHQREDGFIAMAYQMERNEPAYGDRINPPLFAWAELEYARQTGDRERLRRVLPHLVQLFDWYKANRRRPDGLYWYEDSGSTGMDNSPRSGYASQYLNGSDICHVDLISQQAFAAETITTIAMLIGEEKVAARFIREREELLPLVAKHWCKRTGFYYDLFYHTDPASPHNYVNHRTIAAFWPMFAGLCSAEQAERLVKALLDPEDFGTPHPIATLSRQDPNYNPKGGYWLGGVWAPTNYMVISALRRYGYHTEARELASRHLNAMERVASDPAYGGIWECYAPELDRPATSKGEKLCRPNFVGWSGLGPIPMLIEDIMGLSFDALAGEVRWRISAPGEQGIAGLLFDGGTLSLHALPEQKILTVETDRSFSLFIDHAGKTSQHSITPGKQDLPL